MNSLLLPLLALALAIAFTACSAPPPSTTQSQVPEITSTKSILD